MVAAQAVNDVWPPPRSYHTSTLVVHSDTSWKLFVIGGKGKVDLENEVYELKVSVTGETSRPTTPGGEAVKKKSYELSKDGKVAKAYSNEVPRIEWRKLDFGSDESPFYHLPSERPAARYMHTATPIAAKKILVLGGRGRAGRRLADLWELDTSTYKWQQLRIRGWGPASGHAAVEIEEGRLLVLGGEAQDGKPIAMDLYVIDYATAPDVPIVEVHKGELASGPGSAGLEHHSSGAADIRFEPTTSLPPPDNAFGGLRGTALQKPEPRTLHTLTELKLDELDTDTHGDQSAGVELREPVIHPTHEARYFFKKDIDNRDHWSRDLSHDEVIRKHWSLPRAWLI